MPSILGTYKIQVFTDVTWVLVQVNNIFTCHSFDYLCIHFMNNVHIYQVASSSTYTSYSTITENLARFVRTSTQKLHQEEYINRDTIVSVIGGIDENYWVITLF